MISVKQMELTGSAKKYAGFAKMGKLSFVRKDDTKGVFILEIPMLFAKFSYSVDADSSSEMDVVQKFCSELVKAF